MRAKCTIVAVLILLALSLVLLVAGALAQYSASKPIAEENSHPAHKTLEDFEESIGFRYVEAMSKDHRLLFYKKEYKNRIFLGSFGYDKYTRIEGSYEGKLCVLYCKTHMFALIVAPCEKK